MTNTADRSPRTLASAYFDSWQGEDFDRLRTLLAEHATFVGPMGSADGADECIAGLRGMSTMMTGVTIRKMLADETDVITWYDLHTDSATVPTVNWSQVENGLITRIRATFDPRPVLS